MSDFPAPSVEATAVGAALRLRAQPGARRNALACVREGELCVAVTAPPDRGKANDAIVALLAETLGVARGRIVVTHGRASRRKRVEIADMSPEAVLRGLSAALGPRG